jgi:hypothetical protein
VATPSKAARLSGLWVLLARKKNASTGPPVAAEPMIRGGGDYRGQSQLRVQAGQQPDDTASQPSDSGPLPLAESAAKELRAADGRQRGSSRMMMI